MAAACRHCAFIVLLSCCPAVLPSCRPAVLPSCCPAVLLQIELDEHLSRILPNNLTRFFYCNSGSEAVENAVKIARAATGRQDIIAFDVSCDTMCAAVKSLHTVGSR
jgi:hypothetical protein